MKKILMIRLKFFPVDANFKNNYSRKVVNFIHFYMQGVAGISG